MVQKEKELLLKDLCARLPYKIQCRIKYIINNETTEGKDVEQETDDEITEILIKDQKVKTDWVDEFYDISCIKPYLRPMSSMTEEEKNELKKEHIKDEQLFIDCIKNHPERRGLVIPHFAADWCDKNMFAYRTLYGKDMFELGLALEAPEGMYDILSWNK